MTIHQEFEKELKALLMKYRAEMTVAETTVGHMTSVEGIEVFFDGIYDKDGNVVQEFSSHIFPSTIFKD